MRTGYRSEADEWTTDGSKINDPQKLEVVHRSLEEEGPIIVEHWHYRGAHAPDRFVFDDYDEFMLYLGEHAFAGDAIHIWSFSSVCKDENELVHGKCPDENGLVPRKGAY